MALSSHLKAGYQVKGVHMDYLTDLAQQRELGSVTPLIDRRNDLYEIRAKSKIEVIRTI